jgi:phytoene dehydrogenase-like protein
MTHSDHDVVIVGGGHNGLVAAANLARSGKRVLVLERDDHVGGAAVSAQAFDGVDARLSRYSYLVSLLPQRIIDDLGLDIRLARRRYSSYTPDPSDPSRGLLVDGGDAAATEASFAEIGAAADAGPWTAFYEQTAAVGRAIFPTLTEPLPTRSEARRLVGAEVGAQIGADADPVWRDLIERPLGAVITETFGNDLVRGVVATDGLIGTFTDLDDESLDANRCFLYHVIGGGTGDWDVPIGGMGAVSGELERAARQAGAEILTGATVTAIDPSGAVSYERAGDSHVVRATWILANVAPVVLERLVRADPLVEPAEASPRDWPEGAQVKVNLMLERLPRLRDASVSPEAAFGGTFHINETYTQLEDAYRRAVDGAVPDPLPCEIYCHSLSDPSILSPELAASGAHTLTLFGLHVPDRLITPENNDERRAELQAAALASLNSVLAEPIESVIMTDAAGRPCVETKTTLDIERAVGMPGGNIFHGVLSWPFLEDDDDRATSAQRWGVATADARILLCGSGARRGGAVSGIGGHNAAMAVLESMD